MPAGRHRDEEVGAEPAEVKKKKRKKKIPPTFCGGMQRFHRRPPEPLAFRNPPPSLRSHQPSAAPEREGYRGVEVTELRFGEPEA